MNAKAVSQIIQATSEAVANAVWASRSDQAAPSMTVVNRMEVDAASAARS